MCFFACLNDISFRLLGWGKGNERFGKRQSFKGVFITTVTGMIMCERKEYEDIADFLENLKHRMKNDIRKDSLIYTIVFAKYIDAGFVQKKAVGYPVAIQAWPAILKLSYKEFDNEGYPGLNLTNKEILDIELMLIYYSKILAVEKILDMCKYKLGRFNKIDDYKYQFILNTDNYPMERAELEDYYNYCDKLADIELYKDDFDEIQNIMKRLLFVHNEKYIGYDADNRVDMYFEKKALEKASKFYGCLDFDDYALFGGIAYKDYVAAVITFIGITLKHLEFCRLHIEMHPEIKIVNIIDVYHTEEDNALTLYHALNIPIMTARKIIGVLTTHKDDLDKLKDTYNHSYPMFLKVSKTILMRNSLSFLVDPFMFLFQQLQNRFTNDWNRENNGREKLFRQQLYSKIPDEIGFIKIDKNINIYSNKKRVTDIDAIIIDKETKTMAVFQLKWQEPFGDSLSKRNSKKNNFISTSNKWIESVHRWLEESSNKEKADAFNLKSYEFEEKWNYKLFVIGRHFSRFSIDNNSSNEACWCNWYRFINFCEMTNQFKSGNYIDMLYELLEASYKKQQELKVNVPNDIIEIEGWKFYI